jgi:hypothetical protein
MRKRKFLIGTAATLALSVGISGVAHAAGTLNGQTVDAVVNSGKQDKKKPGPITTFTINVDTQYTGTTAPFDNKANNTKVDFPRDWSFFTNGIPQCNPATISTLDTAAAQNACRGSIVGSGKANLAGAVAGVTAVVTAFNGTPAPGGEPVIILHSRTSAPLNSTASLIGTLRNGPGGPYGKTLDVVVPALGGGAFVITHFETTIPKKLVKKANKKKKKAAKYFVAAKCSKKSWQFQARSTYTTPANTQSATTTADTDVVPCKQKKKKKKKKK